MHYGGIQENISKVRLKRHVGQYKLLFYSLQYNKT